MREAVLASVFAGLLTFIPNTGMAQRVLLENPDLGIHLYGDLLEVSHTSYKIRTAVGELLVPSDQVDCVGEACPPTVSQTAADVSIAGSDTVGSELMPLLIRGYGFSIGATVTKMNVGDRSNLFHGKNDSGAGEELFSVFVEDHGSSTGFKALLAQTAEIGMSSRPVKSAEVDAFRASNYGDMRSYAQEHAVAADGLLLLVHPDNPVSGLTYEQISGLLSGQIKNWSDVGGPDLPVSVYSRDNNSGTFSTISKQFLEPFAASLAKRATIVQGNGEMASSIESDTGAIGYTGIAFKGDTKPLSLIASCGLAASPSAFAAKAGEYPLSRQLYLYTRNETLSEHAKGLIDFATSPAADEMVIKSGFIAFGVDTQSQEMTATKIQAALNTTQSRSETALLQELYKDLFEWHRLSPTFRFRSGSTLLDNSGIRDLERLHDHLKTLGEDAQVMLVGFTDSDGPLEANIRLSKARAEAVRRELLTLFEDDDMPQIDVQIKGYGEVNPVACNDSSEGQKMNRRVEAWIKS